MITASNTAYFLRRMCCCLLSLLLLFYNYAKRQYISKKSYKTQKTKTKCSRTTWGKWYQNVKHRVLLQQQMMEVVWKTGILKCASPVHLIPVRWSTGVKRLMRSLSLGHQVFSGQEVTTRTEDPLPVSKSVEYGNFSLQCSEAVGWVTGRVSSL